VLENVGQNDILSETLKVSKHYVVTLFALFRFLTKDVLVPVSR
jgi:RNAse (barnase) inhibitor barstar